MNLQDSRSHVSVIACAWYAARLFWCTHHVFMCDMHMLTLVSPELLHRYNSSQSLFISASVRLRKSCCTLFDSMKLSSTQSKYTFYHHVAPNLFIIDILPVNAREETVSHYFFCVIWSSTQPKGEQRRMFIFICKWRRKNPQQTFLTLNWPFLFCI